MEIKIEDIFKNMDTFKLSNEELFKMDDFKKALQLMPCENDIKPSDCIITPYYVKNNMVYELYAYELRITIVRQKDFNKHLLTLTGCKKLKNVPNTIITRQKICYLEILQEESLKKDKLQTYIDYLFNSQELKKEVMSVFPEYKRQNMYFEIY